VRLAVVNEITTTEQAKRLNRGGYRFCIE